MIDMKQLKKGYRTKTNELCPVSFFMGVVRLAFPLRLCHEFIYGDSKARVCTRADLLALVVRRDIERDCASVYARYFCDSAYRETDRRRRAVRDVQ